VTASKPRISVVIPAHNGADTLGAAFASLTAQSIADWEAILVNDGSTDSTARVAEDLARRDPRLRVLNQPRGGASAARNAGLAVARSEWVLFLDADDEIAPTHLERMLARLCRSPGAVAAYCFSGRLTAGGEQLPVQWSPELADPALAFLLFARFNLVTIHAVVIQRRLVLELGGFDPMLRTCEEWDLWQRVARTGSRWVDVPEVLAFYRSHGGSLTSNVELMLADAALVIRRARMPDPRVPSPDPRFANGVSDEDTEVCVGCFGYWCAALDVGRGGDGSAVLARLGRVPGMDAREPARMMVDGFCIGAAVTPARLLRAWATLGAPLERLCARIGAASTQPGFAPWLLSAIQLALLRIDALAEPVVIGNKLGARCDLRFPREVVVPDGVDTVLLRLAVGRKLLATHELPVWGNISVADIASLVAGRLRRRVWTSVGLRARPLIHRVLSATKSRLPRPVRRGLASARRLMWGPAPAGRREVWEQIFARPDPWNYTSSYEAEKYALTLSLLPATRMGEALELACAEGHFTAMLAPRVERLVATDIAQRALERARARLGAPGGVEFRQLDLVTDALPGSFDLIVCSEVLYYLQDREQLRSVIQKMRNALRPGGWILTAHAFVLTDDPGVTGYDWGHPFGAKVIAAAFAETSGLSLQRSIVSGLYRIDLFRRDAPGQAPTLPAIQRVELSSPLAPEVERFIVWGGAVVTRAEAARRQTTRVPVLMYHRIADNGPAALARYRVTAQAFVAQLRLLRRHGYHAITSADLVRHLESGRVFAGLPVLITFDDGYRDFHDSAWPLLRRADFRAEVFIPTDKVGGTADWDAADGPPAPLMGWREIERLHAQGVAFGSHLASHRAADGLSGDELLREAALSRGLLERRLGTPVRSVVLPYGVGSERVTRVLAACGYTVAFTTRPGMASLRDAPLTLPRIEVRGDWDLAAFARALDLAAESEAHKE
jgi:peptidoglycan/xylan/chitin deacetylase (PgdA/CDA1 family)/GT2 family glycosyltransferase